MNIVNEIDSDTVMMSNYINRMCEKASETENLKQF
uniref:Uncharacterized protein n=1 Tax=Onchocerca volvulus TaxID=6282 RepID=A0A8R1TY64_ONCVO